MTVFKRGETYWTEFVYQGQRIRESTRTRSKKLALEFEDKLRRELHEQVKLGRTKEMTFGEATDHYVATNINTRRKTSDGKMRSGTKDDLGRIKRMEQYFGTDTPLGRVIAPAKIAEYKKHLLATGIKSNSANRILNVLRAVLNAAFKAGGLAREPLIENFPANDARERFLTDDEEKRLLNACPSYLRSLVTFYLDTGARHDEGIKLTWDRVSLVDGGRSSVTFTDTKNGKPRTVPFSSRRVVRPLADHDSVHVDSGWLLRAPRGRYRRRSLAALCCLQRRQSPLVASFGIFTIAAHTCDDAGSHPLHDLRLRSRLLPTSLNIVLSGPLEKPLRITGECGGAGSETFPISIDVSAQDLAAAVAKLNEAGCNGISRSDAGPILLDVLIKPPKE